MTEQTSRLAVIIDSSGAQKSTESLASSLNKLTQSGQQVVIGAGKVKKATDDESKALSDLLDRIDPVNAALNRLDEQQQQLSNYRSKGFLDTETFDSYAKKIDHARDKLTGLTDSNEELAKGLKQIRSQLDPLGVSLEKIAQQRTSLDAAKSAGLLSTEYHAELTNRLNATEQGLKNVDAAVSRGSISAGQYKNAMRQLPAQINDIATSIAGGMPLFTIFMQQGGQIADSFGGWGNLLDIIKEKLLGLDKAADDSGESLSDSANGAAENAENLGKLSGVINPLTLSIGGLVAVAGGIAYAWYKGSQEQEAFNQSLVMTGNLVGKTTGQLADMSKNISSATGSTVSISAQALNRVVSGGKIAADSLESVSEAAVSMNDVTGRAIDDIVSDFDKIAQNPVSAIAQLNEQYHFLTLATYNQIKALADEGNQQDAAKVATNAYADSINSRSKDIGDNLNVLGQTWNWLGNQAKSAWDAMLGIGRERTVQDRIADINKQISDIQSNSKPGAFGLGGIGDGGSQKNRLAALRAQLSILTSQASTESTLNGILAQHDRQQQEGIKAQQFINNLQEQSLTNAQKRTKEQEQLTQALKKTRAAGVSISASEEATLRQNINDKYKDPVQPKERSGGVRGYSEDAGTRLIGQLNQQHATLAAQVDTTDKLSTAQQSLVKWEQQLADIKGKSTLTADQKSLLANQDKITALYQQNAALEKQQQLVKQTAALSGYQGNLNRDISSRNAQYANDESAASGARSAYQQGILTQRIALEQQLNDKIIQLRQQRTSATTEIDRQTIDQEIAMQQSANDKMLSDYDVHIQRMNALRGSWSNGAEKALQEYADSASNVSGMTQNLFSNAFSSMEDSIANFATTGKLSFKGFANSVIGDIARISARMAISGLASSLIGGVSGLFGSASTAAAGNAGTAFSSAASNIQFNAKGGVYDSPSLSSYSNQVYSSPKLFAFAKGAGVFGEAGPEAIMPLTRGKNGSLGVRAIGGQSSTGGDINLGGIVVNVDSSGKASSGSSTDGQGIGKQIQSAVINTINEQATKQGTPLWRAIKGR